MVAQLKMDPKPNLENLIEIRVIRDFILVYIAHFKRENLKLKFL